MSETLFSQVSPTNPAIYTTKVRAAGAKPLCSVRFDKKPYTARPAEGGSRRESKLVIDGAEWRSCIGADCLELRGKVDDEG